MAVLVAACSLLPAQTTAEANLVADMRSAVAAVSSQPALSAWKSAHPRERTDLAHIDTTRDAYEIDFARQNQWCITSVAEVSAGVTRAATFYVPEVARGALPPLPPRQDSTLLESCRLGDIWYEAHGPNLVAEITRQLTADWGAPQQNTLRDESPSIGGSGFWKDLSTWRRGNTSIRVAWTNWDKGNGVTSRTIVLIARDRPADLDLSTLRLDTAAAAARIAALGPALTNGVRISGLSPALTTEGRPITDCDQLLDPGLAVQRLTRWLDASRSLPAERRAASLLVADSYVSCVQPEPDKIRPFAALGVKFGPGCGAPVYANNFRDQAEALDPKGPAGALAALARLQSPCSLKGSGPWPELVLGQKILRQFAPGPWSPWVYLALARVHDVKLLFSLPPGEPESGEIHPLDAVQSRQERNSAIADFAQFIREQPNAPEAVPAWQEAWRLIAGLPPGAIHFGCGCE